MEMKKEDFNGITEKEITTARKIRKFKSCNKISCSEDNCPFNIYRWERGQEIDCSKKAYSLAKQFLELFDTEPKPLNFYERLSATLYKKQILFKQDDGTYYNQRLNENMSKSDMKEWLLAEVGELCKDD